MTDISKKEWAKKMLELDLKAQSGAMWTEEKRDLNAERKTKNYDVKDEYPDLLVPDPICYNGEEIKCTPILLLKQ